MLDLVLVYFCLLLSQHVFRHCLKGDLYRWSDIDSLQRQSGCTGLMLARPALLNVSIFRCFASSSACKATQSPVVPIEDIIMQYIEEVRYSCFFKNCYV